MLASSWSTLLARATPKTESIQVCKPWVAPPSVSTIGVSNAVEGQSARVTVTYGGAGGPFYLYAWDSHGYAIFETHLPTQNTAFEEYLELREIPGLQGGRNVSVMLLNKDYGVEEYKQDHYPVGDNGN